MQRRLTLAMLAIASLAIILVGAGVLFLTQIGARQGAREDVTEQLDALDNLVTNAQSADRVGDTLARLGRAFNAGDLQLVSVDPDLGTVALVGQRSPLPLDLALSQSELSTLSTGDPLLLDSGRSVVGLRTVDFAPPRRPGRVEIGGITAILIRQDVPTVGGQARTWFLVSAGVVLLASALAANWLAGRFIRPIRQIEEATTRIAAGDLEARVDVTGDDELAQLGAAVNTMTADLERSRATEQEFLMSVSHDLRTPLTAISGYAEALTDGAIDEPAKAGTVIGANAKRLNRLVDDLLDLARLSGRRFQFELIPTNCADVVSDTVVSQQPRAREFGLIVDASFDPTQNSVAVLDGQRLAQALGNLIDNALKFAESQVIVGLEQRNGEIQISVRDDGPGIPDADLPFVFERLYVTRLKPKRAENSSGLGLAIVAELVHGMGGEVDARTNTAGGTSMTMRFPTSDLRSSL